MILITSSSTLLSITSQHLNPVENFPYLPMATFGPHTYTLVGKATMEKSKLPTGFVWKCGFFASKSKWLYNQIATKEFKNTMPCHQKTKNQAQRKIETSEAVLQICPLAMATDPANPIPLKVTPAMVLTNDTAKKHQQHDPHLMHMVSLGMVPSSALTHDESCLHWALPIWGLLPEHAHNNGREDTRQKERITRQSQLPAQSTMDKDQPLEQSINACSQKITGKRNKTPTMIHHQVQEWPIPLTLPDSQEGLDMVMAAIDEWLECQEYLKLFWPMEGEDQLQLDGTIQSNIQTGSNSTQCSLQTNHRTQLNKKNTTVEKNYNSWNTSQLWWQSHSQHWWNSWIAVTRLKFRRTNLKNQCTNLPTQAWCIQHIQYFTNIRIWGSNLKGPISKHIVSGKCCLHSCFNWVKLIKLLCYFHGKWQIIYKNTILPN